MPQNRLGIPCLPFRISFFSIRWVGSIRTCGKGKGMGIAPMVQPVDESCVSVRSQLDQA